MSRVVDSLFALAFGLTALAWVTEPFTTIHLILAYLLLAVVACNQYDHQQNSEISVLFSLQVALIFGLAISLFSLSLGGLGIRTLELMLVFLLVLGFIIARPDLLTFARTTVPYLLAFSIILAIFLYHSYEFSPGSSLGIFPVYAGFLLALALFIIPRYVTDDAVLWSVAVVAGFFGLLGLLAAVRGEFTWWLFDVGVWRRETTIPVIDYQLPVVRSVFANPNTLGVTLFAGTVAAAVATVRTLGSRWPLLAIVPAALLALNGIVLFVTGSRASMGAAVIAIGLYVLSTLDRRLLPMATVGIGIAVPTALLGIYLGVLPIDPANRFELWRAGVEAVRSDSSWFGQGLVSTRDAIEPYLSADAGNYTVHNSYLSIFIRIGLLGGLAYLVLVLGPIVHGLIQYERVNIGMFALGVGFAIHQLFEGYTLYQFGPGSIISALALGYVISSLVPADRRLAMTTESETNGETAKTTDTSDAWLSDRLLSYLRGQRGTAMDRHDE